MITRLRIKPNIRYFVRCMSEKPPENDNNVTKNVPDKTTKDDKEDKAFKNNTEKIQSLLKSMMAKPILSESEYREKFTTAPDKPKRPQPVETETIDKSITKAASEVAKVIGEDVNKTEAELLSRVLGKINQTSTSLSDLIVGMKVDRSKDGDDVGKPQTRGQQVKRLVEKSKQQMQTRYNERTQRPQGERAVRPKSMPQAMAINVFGGEPLGIFKPGVPNYGTELDVWESLNQREIALATSQPPKNYFEKMILWTEQGKVWKFPIDNEQGIEEEQNVHFSEHIFLDAHLEGWCPTKGPIRHFMELVCVGLSKNPFYTAQEKKDHILWYKDYFEAKKDMLTEIGVWDTKQSKEAEV